MLLLYAVTDRTWTGKQTLEQQVEAALKAGVTMVQLREKELDYQDFLKEAVKMRELTRDYQVPLLINDNLEIALACDADGVHVGQSDLEAKQARALLGKDKILGVTAKTVEHGNWDLSKIDYDELAKSQATLVFGQMNEPPGAARPWPYPV